MKLTRMMQRARYRMRRFVYLGTVLATAACGSTGGTGPGDDADPGFVRVAVTGPLAPDVAFKFRIAGTGVDSVRNASGTLYSRSLGPGLNRAIVVDGLDRNNLMEFWIPDRNLLAEYGIFLEEVAATETYANQSVASYVVMLLQ